VVERAFLSGVIEQCERSGVAMAKAHSVVLEDPTVKNVAQIRRINAVCLPVAYSESFYKHITENPFPGMSKIGEEATGFLLWA
jgi:predicted DNA-binding transcriptional regulator AlpA